MKLSAIIPIYKDPYGALTIQSLLDNSELGDQLEVIPVYDNDGTTSSVDDPRVFPIYLGKNRGMRDAITVGVAAARGQYILRADSHCLFAPGCDKILTSDLDEYCPEQNCIMTSTRYFLDPDKWEVIEDMEPVNFEKLVIQGGKKFSGARWKSRDEELKDVSIAETMAMQGSMWIMPKQWWLDTIKTLRTDLYGQMYQDSHEMIFYTWKAGGKMLLTKNTWFAHKHRKFARYRDEGTKENPSNRNASWAKCVEVWGDYYNKEIRPKWNI